MSVQPWHDICIICSQGSPIDQGAASMHHLPSTLHRYPLLVAAGKGVVALLLLGVVFVVIPAFPLLAMVGLLWLPTD